MTSSRKIQLFESFFRDLTFAASSLALYSESHRRTRDRAAKALIFLNEALSDGGSLTAMFLGNELFVEGVPLAKTPFVDRIICVAKDYRIGHIVFEPGATFEDILLLLKIVTHQAENDFASTPRIRYGSIQLDDRGYSSDGDVQEIPSYASIPQHLLKPLADAHLGPSGVDLVDLNPLMSLVAGFVAAFRKEANPLLALAPLRELDERSYSHAVNVCILNLAQGMSLGVEDQALHDIGVAGLLHDVGKLQLPRELLAKREGYSGEERKLIREHPVRGAEYLLNMPELPRMAVVTAFEAHMKYDLSGFPKVPSGWQTALCSQLTTISLCFDALRTRGTYRHRDDYPRVAGAMLNLSGYSLNPALTLNFLKVLWKLDSSSASST